MAQSIKLYINIYINNKYINYIKLAYLHFTLRKKLKYRLNIWRLGLKKSWFDSNSKKKFIINLNYKLKLKLSKIKYKNNCLDYIKKKLSIR